MLCPGQPVRASQNRVIGTDNHEVQLGGADFANLPSVIGQMDRPVGDALILAFDKLASSAGGHRKVMLGGEGADELFAGAAVGRFPLVGQITQPGREFYPSTTSVRVQAIYNRTEIAFRVRWNDMRAELAGSNSPSLEVPAFQDPETVGGADEGDGDGFWGDEEVAEDEGDFDRAREFLEEAIELRTATDGNPRDLAIARHNLARLLTEQGHYERAFELMSAALTAKRKLVPGSISVAPWREAVMVSPTRHSREFLMPAHT